MSSASSSARERSAAAWPSASAFTAPALSWALRNRAGDLLADAAEFVGVVEPELGIAQRLGDLGQEPVDGLAVVAVRGQAEPACFDLLGCESQSCSNLLTWAGIRRTWPRPP